MKIDRYDIFLDLTDSKLSFKGKEKIRFHETGSSLSLDSVGLSVSRVRASGKDLAFKVDEANKKLNIENRDMSTEIEIEFSGTVGKTLVGMYYADSAGGRMLSTQFESTGARMVFPCFDEPIYKAVFGISMLVPASMEAISNSPVKSLKEEGGARLYEFQDTPIMSTYLVYLGVADFESRSISRKGKSIILSGPRGIISRTNEALEIASKSLDFYEGYFGIEYAMAKMHLIAVPEFAFGAMENWGAITFRNVALYLDENTSSYIRGRVSEVIAHEIAHQWFGDLVTMKWWNDIWLNESFATFMAYKAVDSFSPDFHVWDDFLLDFFYRAMKGDSLKNTHAVQTNLKTPEEIMQVFDEISYGKGGSILRMIESFVGAENFRKGVSAYLKKFSYSNASGSDLWASISTESGMKVDDVISQWIVRPGYPVIKVSREGGEIVLKQGRFTYEGIDFSETWPIPLTVVRDKGIDTAVFSGPELRIKADGFLKINSGQAGFYRVLYSPDLLAVIGKKVAEISPMEVWGMANDTYAFLLSGMIDIHGYRKAIEMFTGLDDPLVSRAVTQQLGTLCAIRTEDSSLKQFAVSYVKGKLKNIGERKPGEMETVSMMRGELSGFLARNDDEFARERAKEFDNLENLDPNVRISIAISFARINDDPDRLLDKLNSVKAEEDRVKITAALGWVKSERSLEKVVAMVKEDRIKRQDMAYVIYSMAQNPGARKYLAGIYEEVLTLFRQVFASTIYPSDMVEQTIPYLGLEEPEKIRKIMSEKTGDDISIGTAKGLEYLDIYGRIRKLP